MYRLMKKLTWVFIVSLTACMLSGCSISDKNKEPVSETGFYFDTVIQISIVHENGEELLKECFSICQELENTFSKTKTDSELYQVNHRTDDQVEISEHLYNVIQVGLDFGAWTEGAFDITIAPLTDLWDFKNEPWTIPNASDLANAAAHVDYTNVHLEYIEEQGIKKRILTFDSRETMLDLGGLAKGYAADCLKEFLMDAGVEHGFINLGGNVQTIGAKVDGSSWKIGIQEPFEGRGTVLSTVEVKDQSVVSSGIYERYFQINGELYHHVLDPFTGYPFEASLDQVTVVCDSSLIGDAVSTSCLLLGEEKSKELLENIGFSNVWLHLDERCVMIKQ